MNIYLQFQENWRRRVFFWSYFTWNNPSAFTGVFVFDWNGLVNKKIQTVTTFNS